MAISRRSTRTLSSANDCVGCYRPRNSAFMYAAWGIASVPVCALLAGLFWPMVPMLLPSSPSSTADLPPQPGEMLNLAGKVEPVSSAERLSLKGSFEAIDEKVTGTTVAGRAGLLEVLPPGAPTLDDKGEPITEEMNLGFTLADLIAGKPLPEAAKPKRSKDGLSARMPDSGDPELYIIDGSNLKTSSSGLLLKTKADQAAGGETVYIQRIPHVPFHNLPGNSSAFPTVTWLATNSEVSIDYHLKRTTPEMEEWWIRPQAPKREVRTTRVTEKKKTVTKTEVVFVEFDSFVIPESGWEHIWLIVFDQPGYAGEMGEQLLPPAGLNQEETLDLLAGKSDDAAVKAAFKELQLESPLPATELGWWGLYWQVDGKRYPFTHGGKLFAVDDAISYRGKKVTVGMNIPDKEAYQPTEPPQIRFGVQGTRPK